MRILMYGWEFPPHVSGGLGTACEGMTRALAARGHEIVFVLPRADREETSPVRVRSACGVPVDRLDPDYGSLFRGLRVRSVASRLTPYLRAQRYRALQIGRGPQADPAGGLVCLTGEYGPDLLDEVFRYGAAAGAIARQEPCAVIHAHDWMAVFAGLEARRLTGKPLVLHIHALEFDRSGEFIHQDVYDIERFGMEQADRIITVSHYTKGRIADRYGIDPAKIAVVHNAVSRREGREALHLSKADGSRTVLFLGRITFQKGPDYFVEAAARVLRELPETTFLMAGAGDMLPAMVERVAALGMGRQFHFTGFLQGEAVERIFALSDLYVMPSVSEPFGIAPLEAMMCDVPVIISRQSGVSEVVRHALKADFWDVEELANLIVSVLRRPVLAGELHRRASEEIRSIRWEHAARDIEAVYRSVGESFA